MTRLINEGKITREEFEYEIMSPAEILYYAGTPKIGDHVDLETFRATTSQGGAVLWEDIIGRS
jgi:hypothetical protein